MKRKLLVVSGLSGSGKDAVINEIIKKTTFKRLITCADRKARKGEVDGTDYYFVSSEEMDEMYIKGELVEKPLFYGTSRKATPRKEFKKIIGGEADLIWRIESSLASKVASNEFFDKQFEPKDSTFLKESTIIIFIIADPKDVERRRKLRDGDSFNPKDYKKRDEQDAEILQKYQHLFTNIIENKEGKLEDTVNKILELIYPKTSSRLEEA